MASSSVSQESLDHDDYEISQRRSRVRMLRSRTAAHKNESIETTDDKDQDGEEEDMLDSYDLTLTPGHVTFAPVGGAASPGLVEHDSPTRLMGRGKDKRLRPSHVHMHKGKAVKDKRKLREKRRSTGVVHLQATGSTGDSLDEDEEVEVTRRNTSYNEVIDADNPQTPEEERKIFAVRRVRNKSPSDLDADLEDNQDYDSTVSQSETNLTTVGQSSSPQSSNSQFHLETSPDVAKPTQAVESHVEEAGAAAVCCPTPSSRHPLPAVVTPRPLPTAVPCKAKDCTMTPGGGASGVLGATGGTGRGVIRGDHHHHHHHHHRHQEVLDTKLLARNVDLERQLDCEREENRRLQELLDERDKRISLLEQELALLNKRRERMREEKNKVEEENNILIRTMSILTTSADDRS